MAVLTKEELEALPVDSVVIDFEGDRWTKTREGWDCASTSGDDMSLRGWTSAGLDILGVCRSAPVPDDAADEAAREVLAELTAARANWPAFNSAHEGYAILAEEVDELWEIVRQKPSERDPVKLRAEACQVAAMAIRFMLDIAGREAA